MKICFNTISFSGIPINKRTSDKVLKIAETSCIQSNSKGILDDYTMSIISDIKELFFKAHSAAKEHSKSCRTTTEIKNSYPNRKTGISGSKIIEFTNIGPNGEDISINLRIDHKMQKTIVIAGDKTYVINPKGQIEKNPSMKFMRGENIRKKGDVVQYYSQDEINSLDINNHLYALKQELQKYLNYINDKNRQLLKFRASKTDSTHGNVDKYKGLIEEVTEKFNYFKTHINKLSEKALDKDVFRILNKIKTFHAQRSIMFKKAAPDERSLFLVYSVINKLTAMKIFVMDYNNKTINQSFVIYKNKLAKYSPKNPNDKPAHLEYDFHYYTQEEIDNSDLKYYLELINQRLSDVNKNLKQGIIERKNKK